MSFSIDKLAYANGWTVSDCCFVQIKIQWLSCRLERAFTLLTGRICIYEGKHASLEKAKSLEKLKFHAVFPC